MVSAEEHARRRVELLVDDVHLLLDRIVLREHLRPDRQEPGRDDQLVAPRRLALGEQVAGDLLLDETVDTALSALNDAIT